MKEVFLGICACLFGISMTAQELLHSAIYDAWEVGETFPLGVASGDPSTASIVLWTFVQTKAKSATVGWKIATDTSMFNVVHSGRATTDATSGYTAKVQVQQLSAGTTYFYQFTHSGAESDIGRTRTVPIDPDNIQLGIVSCADFQTGHFNAFRHLSTRSDIAAIVHLGDYIYETSAEKWGPPKQRRRMYRSHIPTNTLILIERLSYSICSVSHGSLSTGVPSIASLHLHMGRS